jgi:hypothetical protein
MRVGKLISFLCSRMLELTDIWCSIFIFYISMGLLVSLVIVYATVGHVFGIKTPSWVMNLKCNMIKPIHHNHKGRIKNNLKSKGKFYNRYKLSRNKLLDNNKDNFVISNNSINWSSWYKFIVCKLNNNTSCYKLLNRIQAFSVYFNDIKGSTTSDPRSYDNYAMTTSCTVRFDTDSFPIKIDNCCTQTISGFKQDFIPSTLRKVNDLVVRGFANTKTKITRKGTVQ